MKYQTFPYLFCLTLYSLFIGKICGFVYNKAYSSTTLPSTKVFRTTTAMNFCLDEILADHVPSLLVSLETYEKEGIPPLIIPLVVSLVAGTVLLPLIARKLQLKRNTRARNPTDEDII